MLYDTTEHFFSELKFDYQSDEFERVVLGKVV